MSTNWGQEGPSIWTLVASVLVVMVSLSGVETGELELWGNARG